MIGGEKMVKKVHVRAYDRDYPRKKTMKKEVTRATKPWERPRKSNLFEGF